jgi:uncharacterized membrane protein YkoI
LAIKGAAEAEEKAKEILKEKHPNVFRIIINKVDRTNGSWLIQGEVCYKRLKLFTTKRKFKLEINAENGKLITCQENTCH